MPTASSRRCTRTSRCTPAPSVRYPSLHNLPSHPPIHATNHAITDETTASITALSSLEDRDAASASNRANIDAITALVTDATSKVDGLSAAKMLFRRQTGATLATIVSTLLIEISSTLNGIIGTLGLGELVKIKSSMSNGGVPDANLTCTTGSLLGSLNPLVGSLSALLIALRNVVDNLLELVQEILNGLLTGLSIGLAGLIL